MKKITFAILLTALLWPAVSVSQISDYGLKFGLESAGARTSPKSADGRITGFSMYAFTDLDISRRLFSTIDLGFTQRGFTTNQNQTDERGVFIRKVTATSRVSYISLAPFLNIDAPVSTAALYAGVAPRFDLLVQRSPGTFVFPKIGSLDFRLVDYFDRFILGTSFVTGIKNVSIGGVNFRLEGKYEIDITDSMSKYPAKYRNNVLMLVLGVTL